MVQIAEVESLVFYCLNFAFDFTNERLYLKGEKLTYSEISQRPKKKKEEERKENIKIK